MIQFTVGLRTAVAIVVVFFDKYFVSQLRFELRYDYDTTTTKSRHVHFLLASNRVEWKQARAIRHTVVGS